MKPGLRRLIPLTSFTNVGNPAQGRLLAAAVGAGVAVSITVGVDGGAGEVGPMLLGRLPAKIQRQRRNPNVRPSQLDR